MGFLAGPDATIHVRSAPWAPGAVMRTDFDGAIDDNEGRMGELIIQKVTSG